MKILSFVVLSLLAVSFSCVSCSKGTSRPEKSAKTEKEPVLGTYVYLDRAFVLHTKNGCKAVYKDHNMQEVRPLTIDEVTRNRLERVCSQCVTEEQIILMSEYLSAKEEAFDTDSISVDYNSD